VGDWGWEQAKVWENVGDLRDDLGNLLIGNAGPVCDDDKNSNPFAKPFNVSCVSKTFCQNRSDRKKLF
jgi:hypothetical protein